MQIIVDDMLTHYERSGRGPVVLILPGWADTSRSWLQIQKNLSGRYDVVILDIPGFGGSQAPEGAWDLTDYTAFAGKFLHKLGLDTIHGIIGHSNGGAMAVRGLATSQFSAKKLLLVASAGIRDKPSGRSHAVRMLAKAGKVLAAPLPDKAKRGLRARLYTSVGSDMLVAEHMQESFKKIVADDVRADAPKIDTPALLLYGEADRDTPPAYGQILQKLMPQAELEIIPAAGHFLHLDEAGKVSARALEFLA